MQAPILDLNHHQDSVRIILFKGMLEELYVETDMEFHRDVLRFCHKLAEKEDCLKGCLLYHLLIGGTPPEACELYDLCGEYSIEQFINEAWLSL